MRLINVNSMEVETFDNPPERYVILSHTWGKEEVTLPEYLRFDSRTQRMRGFQKIRYTCEQAKKVNIPYAWVDTCCIDKSSSAELSEAINSMFKWYQSASVCYVYLEDVETITERAEQFRKSRWFRRGWTLQELVAPESIEFYGRHWYYLGTKKDLIQHIASASGVFETILLTPYLLRNVSVAARMSWASLRKTTREEDRAYSLLGIFDVHMPLLYGEGGQSAFVRLQEQIMKSTDDESLFAWCRGGLSRTTLLASSPSSFQLMADVIPVKFDPEVSIKRISDEPFLPTSRGLKIELPMIERPGQNRRFYAVLQCCKLSAPDFYLSLLVRKRSDIRSDNRFDVDQTIEDTEGYAVQKASVSGADFRTIYISDKWANGGTITLSHFIYIDADLFKTSPLFNLSFTSWDCVRPSYTITNITTIVPNQNKVTVQFVATLISEPRIAFLGVVERDLIHYDTFVHAVPRRSDSWLEEYLQTAGDVYRYDPAYLRRTTSETPALGMCWWSRDDDSIFVVGIRCPSPRDLVVESEKICPHRPYFSSLEKFVDGPSFDLEVFLPGYKGKLDWRSWIV